MKTKTQFTNRILSLVLSIMMVVSMLPMSALTASAADGDACASTVDCTGAYVNGFCTVCDGYEPATLVTNENYESFYLEADYVGYYAISNAGQLFWFAQQVNVEGNKEIKGVITADIDLENRPWTPIGAMGEGNSFRGVFDGLHYTIRGLYVEGSENGVGFFGEVRTGTVKNFTVYGNVVVNTEVDYVGGVIGSICGVNGETDLERNGAIVQNITSIVNITVKAHGVGTIGGLVGHADHQSLIEQCVWYGTFNAGSYRVDSGAGGFIGKIQENSEVTIRNCGAYGTIKTGYAKNSYNNYATIYIDGFLSFSNTGAKTTLENCLFAGRFERGENLTDEAQLAAFGTLRSVNAIKNCYYLGDDGLAAVHSDSDLKPGSDNVEITSVTGEELRNNTIATQLGDLWEQGEYYPKPKDTGSHSHSYTYTDNGDGTHDQVCSVCDYVEVDNEAHSGGTATCIEQAKCQHCGASYGELGEHNINNNVCTECGFTYYNLWVGGVQVNSDNAENVLGDGTVSYDADTQTITLSDADISTAALSENVPALKVMNGNITLVLVGENKLTGAENCPGILIESGASVTVAQDSAGSLDVQGQALGYLAQEKIYVNGSVAGDGDFTVSGGTVTGGIHMGGTITITGGTVNADFLAAENVVISGGTVTAAGQAKMYYIDENAPNGTYGIYADNDIQISGGSVTVSGGYANITESYVPMKIPKASATAAMYAGNAVTVTGGTVTATGGTWNGYYPNDLGFMEMGSGYTEDGEGDVKNVIDKYGKALKASSFTISDEASFTCGDGTPGNHSHSYADAACTSGVICAFCGISGESGTTQHTMDSTTGKCVCGLEMAEASATIGGVTTYYSTLDAAIQAVSSATEADNATVKLLKDATTNITFPDISGVFTLDLNGNELKGQLNIVDSNTAVTVIDSKGDGKISGGYYGVHAGENSTVTISGGSISGTNYDIYSDNASITLSLGMEGVGATFPGGISVCGTTLGDILSEGLAYWQGKTMIVLESGQTAITGGDVTVKAACDHIGSQHTAVTDNHDGAHIYDCTLCGATIVEEHSFENDAHKCVCGKVETFTVSWFLSGSLMQSTSTYGQEFTQTFTVPENTHLRIDSVYLANDASVPVNYTYENGVLTIAATDVPAADVYIDCDHNVLVTFHANGGEIIPEDGYPQEGSNDIFPEDGSYWTQEWNYGSEICLLRCAAVRREGYTFVDWRDASGQVHQVIPGNGNYTLATEDITLYAQWQCNHTIGGVVFRDNGNGTHNGYCGECDELLGNYVEHPHNFDDNTHKCVCGKVETFTVYWTMVGSLMQSTSTYGQDFTQTFNVPENTHLRILEVNNKEDGTQVKYSFENDTLTIAAEDLPAADIDILCEHYVEVKFDANGGVIKPHDGFPKPDDTGFAEDGSYWVQECCVGDELNPTLNAELLRTGYTFVGWRDASGKVYPMGSWEGKFVIVTEDVTLYAQWQCNHTIGGVVFRDNGNGTHNGYCGECGELLGNYVEHPHNFGDNTHKCVCGKKVTPEVTAPTAKTNLIYDGSEQELINAGSTTGGTLQYSLDNVTWSAEIPTAITAGTHTVYYKVVGDENYEDVEAQSIIVTITDKTAPTGMIRIKENGWNKFWNTITFGIFCKDYVDVTVIADGTGSGVTKVEYLLSDTVLEENNIPVDGWTTLNADNGRYSFSIKPQNKVAVYVCITDEGDNVTVINSDGIVVYEDSKAVDTEVTYTYKENSNKDIAVEFNGNTVKSIVCSEKVLAANSDYTVDYESGKIVLTASYLDTLNAGDYTFTVSYNPMGVENSGVTDLTTTFIVKVEPTSITGATVNVSGTFTYDGNAKTPDPVVVLNGETLVKDRDYTVSYAENVNAGTATVTVTGKGNYSGTKTATFSIAPMELDETNTVVTLDQNTFVYDGTEHKPAVTVTFNGATLTEGVDYRVFYSQPMRIVNGKVDKWFSDHTTSVECVNVDGDYYAVVVGLGNFRTKDAFTLYANFVIEKATVTEPTIASKPYNGSVQTADITDTELYTVVKNDGGTGVKLNGYYDVVLKLKDSANYKWSTTENAQVTLPFAITRAENEWAVNPSISGWTYGETANEPVGEAKFGADSVEYSGTTNGGAAYSSSVAPTEAGSYKATFTVQETEDYKGLETSVDFTIAKKAVTVTANDAGKTYGESDPALTYTHTELVGSDALIITVARASGENANTYTINASQAEGANPNYEITFKTGTFTIHKATLTVTVEDKTATYGDAVPTYTVKYEGFKNGDDKDDLGGALAFECGYAQFSDKGKYTIKASGYTSGNYTISYVDGKLTVNAKPITVTIQNATSVYGDTLAELKATDNGIVNGDANVYSLATTATGTSNVGKYAITGTALDSNYDVTFVNGEYEITKREITITVDAKNTVVNTTLPIYTYKVEGLVGVDTLVTEPTLTCNANIEVIGEYGITASSADAGGNYSIKYVPAKLTVLTDNAVDAAAGYTEELKDYDPATVTSEDKAELDEMLSEINTILADETTTDNGKKALEEVKEQVEKLIKEITDAAEATDTENTEKVENVTPENVTPENKTDLEGAKADLEKALEDNGGNYTEDEKKAIEDEIKRIDEALEVIGNVEAVEEVISKLPAVDTVKPDDEEAIKAITDAQTAYNALSDYEKSLVDEATKANLDKLAAALVAYDIVEGDGSSWTEDSDHNITFVVNGLFGKFVGIKVDGKDVDKANYEVKAGSTIITLKASYLDTLAVGEHTITVVYTDGSTDGAFNVHAKANSPATGDNSNMFLWIALLFISSGAVITLTVVDRKKRVATKR